MEPGGLSGCPPRERATTQTLNVNSIVRSLLVMIPPSAHRRNLATRQPGEWGRSDVRVRHRTTLSDQQHTKYSRDELRLPWKGDGPVSCSSIRHRSHQGELSIILASR